jgi:hypothetical protein
LTNDPTGVISTVTFAERLQSEKRRIRRTFGFDHSTDAILAAHVRISTKGFAKWRLGTRLPAPALQTAVLELLANYDPRQ